jgi:hypothetical protein
LLDIQSAYPTARLFGTNDLRYPYPQALKDDDLLLIAKVYNITLHCDWAEHPLLPRIVFVDANNQFFDPKIKNRMTNTNQVYESGGVFPVASFDFIISYLALNGLSKTTHHEYMPGIVSLLACGGTANLHIGDVAFGPKLHKEMGLVALMSAFTAKDQLGRNVFVPLDGEEVAIPLGLRGILLGSADDSSLLCQ